MRHPAYLARLVAWGRRAAGRWGQAADPDPFARVFLSPAEAGRRTAAQTDPDVIWRMGNHGKPWQISAASRHALWSEILHGEDPVPHLVHAVESHIRGREEDAAAAATRALERDPSSWFAYCLRGAARLATGCYDDAVADYEEAIALKPEAAGAYLGRGTALRRLRRISEAEADVARALARDPGPSLAAHIRLLAGVLRLDRGLPREALEEFRIALALRPDFFEAYIGRAKAWLALLEPERAQAEADRARRLAVDAVLLANGFTAGVLKSALVEG